MLFKKLDDFFFDNTGNNLTLNPMSLIYYQNRTYQFLILTNNMNIEYRQFIKINILNVFNVPSVKLRYMILNFFL